MLAQQAIQGWSATQVRDTVRAIAQQAPYQRELGDTLWNRFWTWFVGWLNRFLGLFEGSITTRNVTTALLVLLVVLIVASILIVLRAEEHSPRRSSTRSGLNTNDPWKEAEQFASGGRYLEAAHALLAAVLASLAFHNRVRLHDSKTTGDYARELHKAASTAYPAFRIFRTRYDQLIYGKGHCTAEEYIALRHDAEPVMAKPTEA